MIDPLIYRGWEIDRYRKRLSCFARHPVSRLPPSGFQSGAKEIGHEQGWRHRFRIVRALRHHGR
jgi:hypothetical protein